jgi:hypothetical protein
MVPVGIAGIIINFMNLKSRYPCACYLLNAIAGVKQHHTMKPDPFMGK